MHAGLLNRHGMELALDTMLRSDPPDCPYTCFVDIDGLKAMNDAQGMGRSAAFVGIAPTQGLGSSRR